MIINPSFSREFTLYTNWTTTVRADGQWASEPLISSEQFGAGGVNSVRGYHEGEVFGDDGWHVSLEQQMPPVFVGLIRDNTPLTVRGSVYMDYARIYLLEPRGRSVQHFALGHGFRLGCLGRFPLAGAFSVFLAFDERRLTTPAYQPYFNFCLTAQF